MAIMPIDVQGEMRRKGMKLIMLEWITMSRH